MAFVGILLVLGVLSFVQYMFYPLGLGFSYLSPYILMMSSVARSFLIFFSGADIILALLLFLSITKSEDKPTEDGNGVLIFLIIVGVICLAMSIL